MIIMCVKCAFITTIFFFLQPDIIFVEQCFNLFLKKLKKKNASRNTLFKKFYISTYVRRLIKFYCACFMGILEIFETLFRNDLIEIKFQSMVCLSCNIQYGLCNKCINNGHSKILCWNIQGFPLWPALRTESHLVNYTYIFFVNMVLLGI